MNMPTCVDPDYAHTSQVDISANPWNLTERPSQKVKKAVEKEDKDPNSGRA